MQAVAPNPARANRDVMGSTETEDEQLWEIEARAVGAGAASGVIAGIGMGIILHLGTELLPVIGAFAGEATVLRGWIVHLVVSMLNGVIFAVVIAYPPVTKVLNPAGPADYILGGMVYGAMVMGAGVTVAAVLFTLQLPWMTASGQSGNVPGPALMGLLPAAMFALAHLVYGSVLGAVYAVIGETPWHVGGE